MSKKLLIRIGLNTLLGLVLVFVWLKFVNLHEVVETLKTVKPSFFILFFLFILLSTFFRGVRLKLLLKGNMGDRGKNGIIDFIALGFVSQFLSFFIPIRAGEVAKSVYLSTQYTLPFGRTVIWIFIDRFLDFFGVLLLLVIFLPLVPNNLGEGVWWVGLIGLIGVIGVALVSIYSQSKAKQCFSFLSKFLIFKKPQNIFLSFSHTVIEGFSILKRDRREVGGILGFTILALISDSLIWLFMFLSLGDNIGILTAILGTQLSALTFLIPAAPGYVGSLEASSLAVWNLSLNVSSQLASAVAVLFHILTVVALLIFGFISIYFLKFDLGLVWRKLKVKNSK